jgi:hypothetical protein
MNIKTRSMEIVACMPDSQYLTRCDFMTEKSEIIRFYEGEHTGTDKTVEYRKVFQVDKDWYMVIPGQEPVRLTLTKYSGQIEAFQNLKTSLLYPV